MLRQKTFDYVPIPIGVSLFNHFLNSHIDFICINNKQAHFAKMYPTVGRQYFLIANSTFIDKFYKSNCKKCTVNEVERWLHMTYANGL